MLKKKLLSLCLLLWLALPSAWLSGQEPEYSDRHRLHTMQLRSLIVKLQLQNKTQSEQLRILVELSNNSLQQLEGLKDDFDLSERELWLLRSIGKSQGEYINSLLKEIAELTKISTRQSSLLKASLIKNKVLTVSVFVGIPAAFILGLLLN
jgi:hypothetical protein